MSLIVKVNMCEIKEVFGSNPLSYDSADGLPIVITIINIIILLMILFWMGNTLQNIRLTIICLYLYVVPTLFLDTIFAIINVTEYIMLDTETDWTTSRDLLHRPAHNSAYQPPQSFPS